MIDPLTAHRGAAPLPATSGRIKDIGQRFEAQFLGEMLKYTGLGKMPETFNGGFGEQAFGDFMATEIANQIARTRPLGIGAMIEQALAARESGS